MNIGKAHQKARAAMKRREDEIEVEELEGGEINLIPYLDIVTNLMLFLLASISSGLILGQINTTLPDRAPPGATAQEKPELPPDARPLNLVVWVDYQHVRIFATNNPDAGVGDQVNPGFKLPVIKVVREPKSGRSIPSYDWAAVNDRLYQIAKRWEGKKRSYLTYRVTLVADQKMPYATIIEMMDAVRCKRPPKGEPPTGCILPRVAQGEDGKPLLDAQGLPVMIGPDNKILDKPYDPDTMALFHEIIFSPGLQ